MRLFVNLDAERKIAYILICLGCITISFNVAAITAVIPVISAELMLPDFKVSQIIPYYMIPYGIGALIYAPLTRRFSYRSVLWFTMGVYAISSFMCGWIYFLECFLIARVCMGIAGASAIPLGLMIIGEFFNKQIRGRLVGVFFGCSFVASVAGIFISGILDWRWLFFIPAILGGITSLSFIILPSSILNKKHKASVNYLEAFKNFKIREVFLFICLISALYHGVRNWFGVYLSRIYHLEKFAISMIFVLAALGGLAGQLIGGYLSDKKSRLFSCYVGILGLSISTMLLAGKYPLVIVAVIMTIISMSWTIGHNGISTVLTDFPDNDRPVIASLNSSVRFVSGGIGFFISSYFVEKSFSVSFFFMGIFLFLLVFALKRIVPDG